VRTSIYPETNALPTHAPAALICGAGWEQSVQSGPHVFPRISFQNGGWRSAQHLYRPVNFSGRVKIWGGRTPKPSEHTNFRQNFGRSYLAAARLNRTGRFAEPWHAQVFVPMDPCAVRQPSNSPGPNGPRFRWGARTGQPLGGPNRLGQTIPMSGPVALETFLIESVLQTRRA